MITHNEDMEWICPEDWYLYGYLLGFSGESRQIAGHLDPLTDDDYDYVTYQGDLDTLWAGVHTGELSST